METSNRKAIFTELEEYCHLVKEHDFMEITEWSNAEGVDVDISRHYGNDRFSLSWGEFKALQHLVLTLAKGE